MVEYRGLLLAVFMIFVSAIVHASTTYVYSPLAVVNQQQMAIDSPLGKSVPAASTFAVDGNYVFYAMIDQNRTAYLYAYDTQTGTTSKMLIDTDVSTISSIDASCGYVAVTYSRGYALIKIFKYSVTGGSIQLQPYKDWSCTAIQGLYSNSSDPDGYVVCTTPGLATRGTGTLYPVTAAVDIYSCINPMIRVAIVGISYEPGTASGITMGISQTGITSKGIIVSQHLVYTPTMSSVTDYIPLWANIGHLSSQFTDQAAIIDAEIYKTTDPEEMIELAGLATIENGSGYTYKLTDGTTIMSAAYTMHTTATIGNTYHNMYGAVAVAPNDDDSTLWYFIQQDNDGNFYISYTDGTSSTHLVKFDFNGVDVSPTGDQTGVGASPVNWGLCAYSDGNSMELIAGVPVNYNGAYYYYIYKYIPGDSAPRIVKKIQIPIESDNYILSSILTCSGDHVYYLAGPRKDSQDAVKIYTLKNFWVFVNPPYFRQAPGGSATLQIYSTIPATLSTIKKPDWVTVNAPNSINSTPQTLTVSLSNDAPQGEYNYVALTYQTDDGTEFTTGIIFETNNLNDPPTQPMNLKYTIKDGKAYISWDPSVDPDGDQVTYVYSLYDNTSGEYVVQDQNTTSTSVEIPVTPSHSYTFSVYATDGQLASDESDIDFTYSISMSVQLLSPVSGTYITPELNALVKYTTNISAELQIDLSTDGTNWTPIYDSTVDGNGLVTQHISLSPGDNLIRAVLTYNGNTVTSDIADVYYDNNSAVTATLIEPQNGAVYQAPQNGSVQIMFTATYDTSAEGNYFSRTYKIYVFDQNGNQITVASTVSDQTIYTLQSEYALPEGNYVAYPVFTSMDGSDVFGDPHYFSVVASTNPNNPPSVPIPYQTQSTADRNVWLQWHPSTDPEGDSITYYVELSDDPSFKNIVFSDSTTYPQALATDLIGGKVYYWKVRACDDKKACSDWSPVVSFAVYDSTYLDVIEPPENGAYVANDNNEVNVPVKYHFYTNTDHEFNIVLNIDGADYNYSVVNGPIDKYYDFNVTFNPGNHVIVYEYYDLNDQNAIPAAKSVTITVYSAGSQQAPIINLTDPTDGYYEEIDPTKGTTTLTARATYELAKDGNTTVAIEYKLEWATTWTTIDSKTIDVTPDNNTTSLVANVTLPDGIYLFRAKVVDPDGITWYSETHTVVLRLASPQPSTPTNNTTSGGGGGGGAGGAPILHPEQVEWNIPSTGTVIEKIHLKNVGSNPIRVKIWYNGDIAAYIEAPPDQATITIPPGDFNLAFRVSGKGAPAGTVAKGSVILAPTGSTIEIPVTINIGAGTGSAPAPVHIDLTHVLLPIVVVGALAVLYLLYAGVI